MPQPAHIGPSAALRPARAFSVIEMSQRGESLREDSRGGDGNHVALEMQAPSWEKSCDLDLAHYSTK